MNRTAVARELMAIAKELVVIGFQDGNVPFPASMSSMALSEIARIIYSDYRTQGKNVDYGAKPYLEAMSTLHSIRDNYMMDSGSSIVAYLLSNLRSWKGEVAQAVKKELNRRLRSV